MNEKVTPLKKQKPDYAALLKPSELTQSPPSPEYPTPERYKQLAVDDIDIYEHNPRTTIHAEYESLKQAFYDGGIETVVLLVTKRPESNRYVLAFGANTRLKIIKELWNDHKDTRFEAVRCVEVPWQDELWLRTNHLVENINRNDMTFWDTAKAFCDLHRQHELKEGREISQREFVESQNRSILNRTAYVFYTFAVETFQTCEFRKTLSKGIVEQIKPRFTLYEQIGRLAGKPSAEAVQAGVSSFDTICGGRFDFKQFTACTDRAMADHLGVSVTSFGFIMDALKAEPKANWERILQRVGWRERAHQPATTAVTSAPIVRELPASPSAAPCPQLPTAFGQPARFAHRLSPEATASKPAAFWDANYPDADRLDTEAQLATIWQLAQFIAAEHNLTAVLKPYGEGVGFFVEPDPGITQPNHRQMWSLLAMLSGQFYPEVYKRLPAESIWSQMLNRAQPAALAWLENGVESPHMAFGRMVYGYAPFGTPSWINYADRRVAIGASSAAYVRLMAACLELLEGAPERFAHISPVPDGTPKTIGNGLKAPSKP